MKHILQKMATPVLGVAVVIAGVASAANIDPLPASLPASVANGDIIDASHINDMISSLNILDNRTENFEGNLTVDGVGNVGIGTNNPEEALHVNGRIRLSDPGGYGMIGSKNNMHMAQNAYFDGTDWKSMGHSSGNASFAYIDVSADLAFGVGADGSGTLAINDRATLANVFAVTNSGNTSVAGTLKTRAQNNRRIVPYATLQAIQPACTDSLTTFPQCNSGADGLCTSEGYSGGFLVQDSGTEYHVVCAP